MLRTFSWGLFALALAVTPALAQDNSDANADKKKPQRVAFESMDADKDGKLTYQEVKAHMPNFQEERFKMRDKNRDGALSADEMAGPAQPKTGAANEPTGGGANKKPGQQGQAAQMFVRADKDGNGSVTFEEVQATNPNFPKERFTRLDKNGDGAITKDELPQPKQEPQTGAAKASPQGGGLFVRADTNKDEKLTLEEISALAPGFSKEKFDQFDKNKDGSLTSDEMPKKQPKEGLMTTAQLVQKADADGNGKVTFEEMAASQPNFTREMYDKLDRNKDGVLSAEDKAEAQKDGKQAMVDSVAKLMEADANKDGSLTFEELTTAKQGFPREAFDRADRNKDGVISSADAQ